MRFFLVVILSGAKNPATSTNFEVNLGAQFSLAFTGNPASVTIEVAGCFASLYMTDYGSLANGIFELTMQRFNPLSVAKVISRPTT